MEKSRLNGAIEISRLHFVSLEMTRENEFFYSLKVNIMGDVLPLERSEDRDRRSDVTPDSVSSAAAPEGEAVDLGAFLARQLEGLNAQKREYVEKLERVATAMVSLKNRMLHGNAPDVERVALLEEFEGAEALRDTLIAAIHEVNARFKEKIDHLTRIETHRRESGREAA